MNIRVNRKVASVGQFLYFGMLHQVLEFVPIWLCSLHLFFSFPARETARVFIWLIYMVDNACVLSLPLNWLRHKRTDLKGR